MGETRQASSRLFTAIRGQANSLRLADDHERARARARLLQAIESSQREARIPPAAKPASVPWRWALGGLVGAACALAVFVSLPDADPELPGVEQPALHAYALDGGEFEFDQPFVADRLARQLQFDDSTSIALAAHSQLRVTDLRSNGATVQLAQGEVSLSVHHEDDTSWQVEAGPWSVHVTGTQFSVAWNPTTEHFRVAVIEGSVRVEGPKGDVAKLGAGESLVRERSEPSVVASQSAEVVGLEPALAGEGDAGEVDELPEPLKTKPSKLDSKPAPVGLLDWHALADASQYAEAWAALADYQGGMLGEADRVDANAMLDLADIARFTDHRGDAKRVLERLRERFAGSVQAGDAAFELGRIASDRGDDDQAASWFETYLDERPSGSLVNDALVRLMNAYGSLEQNDQARSVATRYLERQPEGPHASKARKILGK